MNIAKLMKIYSVVLCLLLLTSSPVYAANKADEAFETYAAEHDLKLVNKVEYTNKNGDIIVAYGAVSSDLYNNNLFYFDLYKDTDSDQRPAIIFAGLTDAKFSCTVISFYSVSGVKHTEFTQTASSFNNFYYYSGLFGTTGSNATRVDTKTGGLVRSELSQQLENALAFFHQPPAAPLEEMGTIIPEILAPIWRIGVLLAIFLLLCLVLLTLLKAFFQRFLM